MTETRDGLPDCWAWLWDLVIEHAGGWGSILRMRLDDEQPRIPPALRGPRAARTSGDELTLRPETG